MFDIGLYIGYMVDRFGHIQYRSKILSPPLDFHAFDSISVISFFQKVKMGSNDAYQSIYIYVIYTLTLD